MLTFIGSDRQPHPNLGPHSIMFDTCALFCLVSISAVIMDYLLQSWGAFKLNEVPPSELWCFKLPKSQESFGLGRRFRRAVRPSLCEQRRVIFFCVVILRDAPGRGSSRGFLLCGYWAHNMILTSVSHVIQAFPLKVLMPPVFSNYFPRGLASTQSTVHYMTLLWFCKISSLNKGTSGVPFSVSHRLRNVYSSYLSMVEIRF